MKFNTIKEAEDYYFENLARTNNMHGEEDARLDRFIEEQEISECNEKIETLEEQAQREKEETAHEDEPDSEDLEFEARQTLEDNSGCKIG